LTNTIIVFYFLFIRSQKFESIVKITTGGQEFILVFLGEFKDKGAAVKKTTPLLL
jgi:hypothetical protein